MHYQDLLVNYLFWIRALSCVIVLLVAVALAAAIAWSRRVQEVCDLKDQLETLRISEIRHPQPTFGLRQFQDCVNQLLQLAPGLMVEQAARFIWDFSARLGVKATVRADMRQKFLDLRQAEDAHRRSEASALAALNVAKSDAELKMAHALLWSARELLKQVKNGRRRLAQIQRAICNR